MANGVLVTSLAPGNSTGYDVSVGAYGIFWYSQMNVFDNIGSGAAG
jgi:hypothetical protein